jgi:phosphatidylglycerol:prolipoprotein diacylglycerol transferase
MERILPLWQHLPTVLDPIALTVGSWPIYWYALFFLFGSGFVYWLARRGYVGGGILSQKEYTDFGFGVFLSALLGGKLGFLLIYWWPFISLDQKFVPQTLSEGIGLPGMSFVGGMTAVALYIFWYARKHQKNFFTLTDILAPFLPLAIFFGRLGSFVHGELLGRVTTMQWGMYFPGETVLRHPSTLYAALLEGFLLFLVLFFLKTNQQEGRLTAFFCVGYGILRFLSESFREPDAQIGYIGVFTLNQLFALLILILGALLLTTRNRKNNV